MKLAYLILAHNQPNQLLRLINRLNNETTDFYIHVDTKCKDVTQIREQFSAMQNVHVISRHGVNWMGFNMVKATVDLLEMAQKEHNYRYYILMSGQDYPIKDNEYITSFFNAHTEDFISYNQMSYMGNRYLEKVWFHHYMDIPVFNPRNPKRNKLLHRLYFAAHNRLRKILPHRTFYNNWEPVFGSQWFALTGDTVRYILDFLRKDSGYVNFMRTTEGPDETFFHTIIYNSPRRSNLYGIGVFDEWLKTRTGTTVFQGEYSSLRYMDWSERGKPKPAILDDDYFEVLRKDRNLFARKLDEKVSASLLNMIDTELLHIPARPA